MVEVYTFMDVGSESHYYYKEKYYESVYIYIYIWLHFWIRFYVEYDNVIDLDYIFIYATIIYQTFFFDE